MAIELRAVTRENYREALRLEVAPEQERFVATNAVSLAQVAFEPGLTPLLAYAGETPVGFAMVERDEAAGQWWIPRVMIGADHQGKGHGRTLMRALLAWMRERHGCEEVLISYVPDNDVAARLYASLGFVPTGEVIDGETVARLELAASS